MAAKSCILCFVFLLALISPTLSSVSWGGAYINHQSDNCTAANQISMFRLGACIAQAGFINFRKYLCDSDSLQVYTCVDSQCSSCGLFVSEPLQEVCIT